MNFAENIKTARKKIGMSQQKLAERLGVVQGTVGNWEAGLRTPSVGDLDRIAKALGTKPEELVK